MTLRAVQLSLLLLTGTSVTAYATTRDDLDFSKQVAGDDFLAIPVVATNHAFLWARKAKAVYEFRSADSADAFQTLLVTFQPTYSQETRDQFLASVGLQDRGLLEPFDYFHRNEIRCEFSPQILAYFTEHQQPAPRVTTTVGGYPALCRLSVRVPTSWKEDVTEMLQANAGLAFKAQAMLCLKESPRLPVRDLLKPLETRSVGTSLPDGAWQASYLGFIYESASLAQNAESVFGKNGGRQLWEKFFGEFTLDAARKLVTLPLEKVSSQLLICQEQPWEVSYVGAEESVKSRQP